MRKLRVLIADEDTLVRSGINFLFDSSTHLTLIAEASSKEEAIRKVLEYIPDVILLSATLPNSSEEVISELRRRKIGTRILVIGCCENYKKITTLMEYGISGYISKSATKSDIIKSIRRVSLGEFVFIPQGNLNELSNRSSQSEVIKQDDLSKREVEIANLIAKGMKNIEIAERLNLSISTVKNHAYRIFKKMNVKSRTELICNWINVEKRT